MTRPQRIHFVAKQTGVSKTRVKPVYDAIIAMFANELAGTGELSLYDFGKFTVKEFPEKRKVLPAMAHLRGKPHFVVKFKPYAALKDRFATAARRRRTPRTPQFRKKVDPS